MKALPVGVLFMVLLPCVVGLPDSIKHFIVIMMENQSFDRMLGFLKSLNPEIDGLFGNETNPIDPSDPHSPLVQVSHDAKYVTADPGHSVAACYTQAYGKKEYDPHPTQSPAMDGFVQSSGNVTMTMFNQTHLPILSTLAMEYGIMDRWHSSLPGPTWENRMFMFSATSYGVCKNNDLGYVEGYPQRSIFKSMKDAGRSVKVYYGDLPSALLMRDTRHPDLVGAYHEFKKFYSDVKKGELPDFTFLEPRYYSDLNVATDQHPSHDVLDGERLLKEVYEALRASPVWNDTLLMITYDEHGGFFDHVPIPSEGVMNPDGRNCETPVSFDFSRLGMRVPTVMVSPWVKKGAVFHQADGPHPTSQYEHSSLPATLKKYYNLPEFLTKRDAWAGTFDSVWSELPAPRTDCINKLPDLPPATKSELLRSRNQPLNDLQKDFLKLAGGLTQRRAPESIRTEAQGAKFVKAQMDAFLTKTKQQSPN